jgi:hypothetical protein
MSKKSLNATNLKALGSAQLAALVMDLVQGNAALQRRARMELSAAQGPKEIAADIRKRFAALRRATSYVNWRKHKVLVKDLNEQLVMIQNNVAPHDPLLAFELLWSFLQLGDALHQRTDDSNGTLGAVFADAIRAVAQIAPRIEVDTCQLADRILDAVVDAGYGEFDGIIGALAAPLGHDGLERLKVISNEWAHQSLDEAELETYALFGYSSSPEQLAQRRRAQTLSIILSDVADAQGDVDGYIAQYTAQQLTFHTIAPNVARRLMAADRATEALHILETAIEADRRDAFSPASSDMADVYEECLHSLGLTDQLKEYLWTSFSTTLNAVHLRKYLKLLPDFDDIDAEQEALDMVEAHPNVTIAISFLASWPDLSRAARLTIAQAEALNGDAFYLLNDAADQLETTQPLAATIIRRAMISDCLARAQSTRYRYGAEHLNRCAAVAAEIDDFGRFASHLDYVAELKKSHGKKISFWNAVSSAI